MKKRPIHSIIKSNIVIYKEILCTQKIKIKHF